MSKIGQLVGKPQVFKIGEVELELKPRTLKDLDLLMALSKDENQSEAMAKLIRATLKEADPEATEQELDNFGMQYFEQLTNAILQVNGLNKNGPKG